MAYEIDPGGDLSGEVRRVATEQIDCAVESLTDPGDDLVGAVHDGDFHEYRKRTKDTWYHVRLLREIAPSIIGPLGRRFHDLADTLGDEHDLAVLGEWLRDRPDCFGGDDEVAAAMLLIDGERADLGGVPSGSGAVSTPRARAPSSTAWAPTGRRGSSAAKSSRRARSPRSTRTGRHHAMIRRRTGPRRGPDEEQVA